MPSPTSRTTAKKAPAARKAAAAKKAASSPALEALRAEVSPAPSGDPVPTWEWAGESFPLETGEPDMRVFALYERGDMNRWLPMVLGEEGAERLLALETDERLTPIKLRELVDAWGAAVADGLTTGE